MFVFETLGNREYAGDTSREVWAITGRWRGAVHQDIGCRYAWTGSVSCVGVWNDAAWDRVPTVRGGRGRSRSLH